MKKLKDPKEILDELGIDEEKNEKIHKALLDTSGFKKVENFVIDLSKKPDFLKTVRAIRKNFEIPENGFNRPTNDDEFEEVITRLTLDDKFSKCIENISSSYKMEAFSDFIKNYILFNDTQVALDYMYIPIIEVEDIYSTFFVSAEDDELKLGVKDKVECLMISAKTHPIGILIHPYMSQRDIIDAIKKIYKLQIEPLQKKYRDEKIKLGIIRRKSKRVEERNKFIYENRTLGMEKLRTAIREKYHEILDETYIYKIIKQGRLENK